MKRSSVPMSVLLGVCLWITLAPLRAADEVAKPATVPADEKFKLVLQVSEADPEKWKLTLSIARNVQLDLGEDSVDIEIVAFGPGIHMLRKGSEAAGGVQTARDQGVKIVACENTM